MFITIRIAVYGTLLVALFSSLITPYFGYAAAKSDATVVTSTPAVPAALSSEAIIAGINEARVAAKLPPLAVRSELMSSAKAKGFDMAYHRYFAHTSPTGSAPWDFFRAAQYEYHDAGENLAVDFFTASDVVSAMMNSAPHRANILSPDFTEIGVGVVPGENRGYQRWYAVVHFGTPLMS